MEPSAAPLEQNSQPATPLDSFAGGRANPEKVRESLEAVRAVQEAARARARRETRRARLIVVGVMAALGIVVWNGSLRRSQKAQRAIAATPVMPAAAVTPAAAPTPPSAPAPIPQPAPVVAAAPAAADPSTGADDVAACNSAFEAHQWQVVATACATAFKARPRESDLAMRVAHAQHRRGYFAEAGDWARSAVALDPDLAEGFAIVARAETKAGHPAAAATAYRRYLTLAPRGWHAAEARRALSRSAP